MKLVAGWWRAGRGLAIGTLIGALSLGSAAPHLLRIFVSAGAWRELLAAAAISALGSALIFAALVRPGPYQSPSSPLDRRVLGGIIRDRAVTLATMGYLGHMWELYAMWSWVLAFWSAAVLTRGTSPNLPALMTFAAIAVGGLGCVAGGWAADRIGRTALTIGAMSVSGACAIIIGPIAHGPLSVLAAVTLLWGFTVVADSAQFSACVTELVPPEYSGTALTLQTSLGFLLTIASIRAVPLWAAWWGWTYAFMPLAIGPFLGSLAMWRLRRMPEALKLASGAR